MCQIVPQQVATRSNGNELAQFKVFHLTTPTTAARNRSMSTTMSTVGTPGSSSCHVASANGNQVGFNTSKRILSSMKVSQSHGSLSLYAGLGNDQQHLNSNNLGECWQQQHSNSNLANNLRLSGECQSSIEILGPQSGLVYMMKNPKDPLIHIHLYESDAAEEVSAFQLPVEVANWLIN